MYYHSEPWCAIHVDGVKMCVTSDMLTVYTFGHNKMLLDGFDNGIIPHRNESEKNSEHKMDDRIALTMTVRIHEESEEGGNPHA